MNLRMLIEELSSMPKDKLLYDSINQPTWHMSQTGEVVLAGSPCPIQTVEQLLHKLKTHSKKRFTLLKTLVSNVLYMKTLRFILFLQNQ